MLLPSNTNTAHVLYKIPREANILFQLLVFDTQKPNKKSKYTVSTQIISFDRGLYWFSDGFIHHTW
jgi:hypothetical protein